ncbi:nucleotide-binding universal stress UspA family protein [Scopulibacillus darangshiensis]|uniref:Nucleotide-binding universal stress UspA family protein n=1 Tax=Scopulibacillus darangshiensis TaxID=442528 RepID=A0A4R2NVI5_9BACL|nr:universal stress protein [Scopulibacillus darangshiensis]TCP25967.1 nucleotide-binding universal stress UspA family protein [Scopulibacillus darangshiensis]
MLCSKILVAYDGSNQATKSLEKAIDIAKTNPDITIDVLYTVELPLTPYVVENAFEDMQKSMHKHGDEVLAKAREMLTSIESDVRLFQEEGQPIHVILEHAAKHKCDLIVMGSRGLSGVKEFLGSVSHHVVQHSSVPVFVVKS